MKSPFDSSRVGTEAADLWLMQAIGNQLLAHALPSMHDGDRILGESSGGASVAC
jgi:hypothetical protein